MKILIIFGTRPEAIKMAPIIHELKSKDYCEVSVCSTGQHREILNQVMDLFDIKSDFDLSVMEDSKDLIDTTSLVATRLRKVLSATKYDLALVHGDTTTTFAAAYACFLHGVNVGHIEAGLRTDSILSPFPEEANRRLTSVLTSLHFAPTKHAKNNLIRDGILPQSIYVTGNTVIDALIHSKEKIAVDAYKDFDHKYNKITRGKKLILITAHRRENFGEGINNICQSLLELAKNNNDFIFLYPVHPNPNIKNVVEEKLDGVENIHLIAPVDYWEFIYLMDRSYLILTDSGGIQEEAPSLGKPVVLLRESTERPEGIEAGTVILTGTNIQSIIKTTQKLIDDNDYYLTIANTKNPYGDGTAAAQIAKIIESTFLSHEKVTNSN